MRFKDLKNGATFRFESELTIGYQGARGPWVKASTRKYHREDQGPNDAHAIGSINAKVREVAPAGPSKTPAGSIGLEG